MIYVTSMPIARAIVEYYLALLPGVIPSHARARLHLVSVGDASPRPLSEKLLERPRLLRAIARAHPGPGAVAPRPVQHHDARAGRRAGARHPDVRRRPATRRRWAPRPAAGGCSPRRACRTRWASRTCTRSTTSSTPSSRMRAPTARRWPRRSSSSTRACPVPATPWSTCTACRRPASPDERAEVARARCSRWQFECPDIPSTPTSAKLAERRRHRRGAHHRRRAAAAPACSCGSARWRGRAAVDPRPAAGRPERAELPGLPVPRRLRLRRDDQRDAERSASGWPRRACSAGSPSTSSWCGTPTARGRVRDRDQPAQGRHDPPVPHPAVPDRRSLRRRDGAVPDPGGHEKHLVATDHLESTRCAR